MIKNLVTFSLMVFIIIVIAILGAAVFMNPKTNSQTINQGTNLSLNTNNASTISTPTKAGITPAQVAKHNNFNDCWLIINNKVYNVTSYIPLHPGGPNQIIPYCGKDATAAFDTKGGRGSHSQNAQNILNNYYVGNLSR